VRLYRSRTADGGTGGAAPFTASGQHLGRSSVSASVGESADPYAALVANVRQQMRDARRERIALMLPWVVAGNAAAVVE